MRFNGKLKTWNNERGFGFITPSDGGQDIFIHISAFPGSKKPELDELLSFEVALNPQGKKKAVRVQRESLRREHTVPIRMERLASRGFTGRILAIAIIGCIAFAVYQKYTAPPGAPPPLTLKSSPAPHTSPLTTPGPSIEELRLAPATQSPAVTPPAQFHCDGRTWCSQMTSCAEARYFLQNCPGVKMDGNHDGTPCQQQWCN